MSGQIWSVYILRCADGTLYTGISNDVPKRLAAHNEGKGAKYTRGRRPVELIYCENCADKSTALRRETKIKKLARQEKLKLAAKLDFEIPPFVKNAFDLLAGGQYEAWLVGGCVRDMLIEKVPHDWDIATSARPEEVQKIFSAFRTVNTGARHGTVTAFVDNVPLEITTYRIDGEYTDNRHPGEVIFTRSLEEDLRRRDFTMNAVAYAPKCGICDPYGGRADISLGIIRCVGDVRSRFREDALRILRALRFASELGFEIEKCTAEAMFAEKSFLKSLSVERVKTELDRVLCGQNAGSVLRKYALLLAEILPEILPMFGLEQHNEHHCYDIWEHTVKTLENVPQEPQLRWAALLHDMGKPDTFSRDENGIGHFRGHAARSAEIADEIMQRLHFDNGSRQKVSTLVRLHGEVPQADRKLIKRRLNSLGEATFFELLLLWRADNLAQATAYHHRQEHYNIIEAIACDIVSENNCFSLKNLAVNGNDLIQLGYKGRSIGSALQALLEAVMDEKVENERIALLEWLKSAGNRS